eukprot:TRINITY_DN785_c0_g1_i2.p1 TRINITY_DN785_c0_g1~~TRINITY_DN785_c0_g1_i2.p1  ORF type:complete len:486 (+),score=70.32 TRINITY_DN785_c0_g1_i2:626-2083(+)
MANHLPNFNYPSTNLPHHSNVHAGRRSIHSFFMPENLRQDLYNKTCLILKGTNPEEGLSKNLPIRVGQYHSFYPLEETTGTVSHVFGVPTTVYKCTNARDGLPYVLRRVTAPVRTSEYAQQLVDVWKQIQHPCIITLREAFWSSMFDSNPNISSLFFVYDYHPAAETLEEKFLSTAHSSYYPEDVIWSFVVQLCSVIECVHRQGQACRSSLTPSKILVTGKNRLRINCVGLEDILELDSTKNLAQLQYRDLVLLGRIVVNLACKSSDAMSNFAKSMEHITNTYSNELKELIITLCNKPTIAYPTINDICQSINGRMLDQLDRLYCYNDGLESELSKEIENGRLFRLLSKLGFINERPEYNMSMNWSETGDRYLVKLFRDYIFHQVSEDGSPVVDFQHVVESLNKLDVGVDEKILLMSRDEKSILVVSYKDLKKIINDSFSQLVTKQAQGDSKQIPPPAPTPPNSSSNTSYPPGQTNQMYTSMPPR